LRIKKIRLWLFVAFPCTTGHIFPQVNATHDNSYLEHKKRDAG
jgi:hypothetical protein